MVKSWTTIKKHESSFDRHCAKHLNKHIKENPMSYPSDISELMSICGVTCDLQSVRNYQRFHAFLVRHRKMTDEKFIELVNNGVLDKYLNNGHSEEEIYHKFIDCCLSYEIIPLYCDIDNKYKLLDLHSFLLVKKSRLKSAGSEIKNKFVSLKKPLDVLPNTVGMELNILRDSPDIKQLQDARDELNRFLPEHNEEGE